MLPTYVSLQMINIALLATVLAREARSQTNDFILQLQGFVCLYFKHTSYLSFFSSKHISRPGNLRKFDRKIAFWQKEHKSTFSVLVFEAAYLVFGMVYLVPLKMFSTTCKFTRTTFVAFVTNMSYDSKWSIYSQLSAFFKCSFILNCWPALNDQIIQICVLCL